MTRKHIAALLLATLTALPVRAALNTGTGGNEVMMTTSTSITALTTNWTIAFWLKVGTLGAFDQDVLDRCTNLSTNGELRIYFKGGSDYMGILVPNVGTNIFTFPVQGSGINYTIWHHYVFTRSGNNWTAYLDGVSTLTASNSNTQTTGGPLVIGGQCGGSANSIFKGVAELAGWTTVLSQAEITTLALGVTPNWIPVRPAYYYPFHRGIATEPDLSGNGWNGSISSLNATNTDNHCPCGPLPGTLGKYEMFTVLAGPRHKSIIY